MDTEFPQNSPQNHQRSTAMAPGKSETAPLLSGGEGSYYFLKADNHQGGTTGSVRDADGGQVVEEIPHGANADEFAPRVIGVKVNYTNPVASFVYFLVDEISTFPSDTNLRRIYSFPFSHILVSILVVALKRPPSRIALINPVRAMEWEAYSPNCLDQRNQRNRPLCRR
jgi:hypothetical protein